MKQKRLTVVSVSLVTAMTMVVCLFGFHHGRIGEGLVVVKEAVVLGIPLLRNIGKSGGLGQK